MSSLEWAWKDPDDKGKIKPITKPELTFGKSAKKKKRKVRNKVSKYSDSFYLSREWKELRYRVIRKFSGECMACGRSRKKHGIVIHVDHIKPRSTHPGLALAFDNLQLLCEECNIGKGNKCTIDWRPANV